MSVGSRELTRHRYNESIGSLYAETTFHFLQPRIIRALPDHVLPARLRMIQAIVFDFQARNDWKALYEPTWAFLQSLTGLRDLRVRLHVGLRSKEVWDEAAGLICQPLHHFQHLHCSELVLGVAPEWTRAEDWANCCAHDATDNSMIHQGPHGCVLWTKRSSHTAAMHQGSSKAITEH